MQTTYLPTAINWTCDHISVRRRRRILSPPTCRMHEVWCQVIFFLLPFLVSSEWDEKLLCMPHEEKRTSAWMQHLPLASWGVHYCGGYNIVSYVQSPFLQCLPSFPPLFWLFHHNKSRMTMVHDVGDWMDWSPFLVAIWISLVKDWVGSTSPLFTSLLNMIDHFSFPSSYPCPSSLTLTDSNDSEMA